MCVCVLVSCVLTCYTNNLYTDERTLGLCGPRSRGLTDSNRARKAQWRSRRRSSPFAVAVALTTDSEQRYNDFAYPLRNCCVTVMLELRRCIESPTTVPRCLMCLRCAARCQCYCALQRLQSRDGLLVVVARAARVCWPLAASTSHLQLRHAKKAS